VLIKKKIIAWRRAVSRQQTANPSTTSKTIEHKNPRLEKSERGSGLSLCLWRIANANPPYSYSSRAPSDWLEADIDQTCLNESEQAEPVPEYEFDQTVSW
jgi:hypothetical protein